MTRSTDSLIEALAQDLAPVRPLRRWRGMAGALLGLAAGVLLLLGLFGIRSDLLAARPDPVGVVSAGVFLVLTLASAWAAIDSARPAVGARRDGWAWSLAAAAVLPLGALFLIVTGLLHGNASPLRDNGRDCITFGLFAGLFTAAILTAWLRRGAPVRLGQAGLLTGLSAGSAGIFAVSLYCPHTDMVHIGIWHGLAVTIAAVLGRLIVPPLLRW
ncbi:MAG: NrsF family protein [Pseudomonadota bacterium]